MIYPDPGKERRLVVQIPKELRPYSHSETVLSQLAKFPREVFVAVPLHRSRKTDYMVFVGYTNHAPGFSLIPIVDIAFIADPFSKRTRLLSPSELKKALVPLGVGN